MPPNPRPTTATAQNSHLAAKRAAFARKRTATVVSDETPAVYRVENLREHEFPVVGVIVHPRIIPGFSYRCIKHPLTQEIRYMKLTPKRQFPLQSSALEHQ